MVSDSQFRNAPTPILVTLLGIVTEVSAAHSLNAPSPILVTPSEMVTDVSDLQSANAFLAMLFTLLGITKSFTSLPAITNLRRWKYFLSISFKLINDWQYSSILLAVIIIVRSLRYLSIASYPSVSMVQGIVIEVSASQL